MSDWKSKTFAETQKVWVQIEKKSETPEKAGPSPSQFISDNSEGNDNSKSNEE